MVAETAEGEPAKIQVRLIREKAPKPSTGVEPLGHDPPIIIEAASAEMASVRQ